MAEPASTAGIALAAGAITVTGSILGVQYDALLLGFIGGLVILSFQPQKTLHAVFASLFTSSTLGGVLAPIVAQTMRHYINFLDYTDDGVRMAAALVVGVSAQTIVPTFLKWLKGKGESV